MEHNDSSKVASLYEFVMRSGSRTPAPELSSYFERTFLDHPWVDPDIPPLVYEMPNGEIGAFLGSHVRRLRFQGERVRLGCSGQLVSDPSLRSKGIGALLLRRYLQGPQELTTTDGATLEVQQMWERLGGSTSWLTPLSWTRLFQPFRFVGHRLVDRLNSPRVASRMHPLWSLLDRAGATLSGGLLGVQSPTTRAEPLIPSTLLEHLPSVARHLRVYPDYDERSLAWLFEELERVKTRGRLIRKLVRDTDGRALGWYVAYLKAGGVGHVVQIAARPQDVAAVIDHLFHDAWRSGTAVLKGRLEPLLFPALQRRRCLFRHDALTLVHSRNATLLNAIYSGQALLTRMEGEWWMGHHTEPFTQLRVPPTYAELR